MHELHLISRQGGGLCCSNSRPHPSDGGPCAFAAYQQGAMFPFRQETHPRQFFGWLVACPLRASALNDAGAIKQE